MDVLLNDLEAIGTQTTCADGIAIVPRRSEEQHVDLLFVTDFEQIINFVVRQVDVDTAINEVDALSR